MPVTQKDIADKLGVSCRLVSFALSGTGSVSPDTRERIREVAMDLGYRPNGMARAMRSGKFNALGLLLPSRRQSSYMLEGSLDAIRTAVRAHDLHLTVGDLPSEELQRGQDPKILRELAVDGFLVNCLDNHPDEMFATLERYNLTSVWMNVRLEHDCVFPDDFNGAKEATRHLLERGHTRIAYFNPEANLHYSVMARREGYLAAMAEANLAPCVVENTIPGGPREEWPHLSAQLLDAQPRPTAALAYEMASVQELLYAALERGLRVPDDLSLLSFHPIPLQVGRVSLATMCLPGAKLGEEAVSALLRKIADPDLMLPPQAIPLSLRQGNSIKSLS